MLWAPLAQGCMSDMEPGFLLCVPESLPRGCVFQGSMEEELRSRSLNGSQGEVLSQKLLPFRELSAVLGRDAPSHVVMASLRVKVKVSGSLCVNPAPHPRTRPLTPWN